MTVQGLQVDPEALERLSPAERDIVASDLKIVEAAFKANPLMGYQPHEKQVVFHRQPAPPSRLFLGGNRSGKTTCTMVDTILQAVDRELVPAHLVDYKRWEPPFYARVVTPDLTSTMDGVVLQKFREWCPKSQFFGGSFDKSFDKVQRMLRFKNGSWIQFFSNDQDLDKFGGAALHRVVYDEEPRADIRRECLMRLIDYGGEELYGMTPLHGMSWVYDEFFEPWERADFRPEDFRIVQVDMDDNPHLDAKTMKWVLSGLTMEERQARKSGRFVAFAGLIYPEWSEKLHIEPQPAELPRGVEVFCSIDPGYRHLCAVLYAYLDQDDKMVIFDEIAMQHAKVSDVCREIRMRNERWGTVSEDGSTIPLVPNWYVIDPAARNKNNQTGRSDQQEFQDYGIYTIPAQNAVSAGINHVKERLAADKLKVTANCRELRSEFKKYRWARDSGRSEHAPAESPVKKDDHALDALRYMVMQRPLAPEHEGLPDNPTMKDRLLRHHLKRLRGKRAMLPDQGFGPGQWA